MDKDKSVLTSVNQTRLTVMQLLDKGCYPAQIAHLLNFSRPAIHKHIKALLQSGIIVKSPESQKGVADFYSVNQSHTTCVSEVNTRTVRTEHYKIKLPILKDNPDFPADRAQPDGLNRWIRKYVDGGFPFDVTLEKTPKSVILHCHQREFSADARFMSSFAVYTAQLLIYFAAYVNKLGVTVDITKAKIISQEMETKEPAQNNKVQPSVKVAVKLERPAQTILGQMNTEAIAFLDRSHDDVEIGTNDLTYEEKLLRMPEKVEKMAQSLEQMSQFSEQVGLYTEQIKLHLSVLGEMRDGIKQQAHIFKSIEKRIKIQQKSLVSFA